MDMSELIDQEILKAMCDLGWMQCRRLVEKWNLPAIETTDLETARDQVERDFIAAHPDLDFDKEWSKCLEEVTDNRSDPLVGTMAKAAGSC